MTLKKVNLSRVKRWKKTGQLAPSSYLLTTCDGCDCLHFEMKDQDGQIFCVALIDPEHMLDMSAAFAEGAKILEERGTLPRRQ